MEFSRPGPDEEIRSHTVPCKKDKDRRKGKGRRCCMGAGIDSIPCRTRNFSSGWFWRKGWIEKGYWTEWMLWKNCWSSGSHHTQPPPYQNGCSPKNFCSNHACCLMDIAAFKYSIQYVPQTTATIFAFSSSLSFFYDMYIVHSTLPLYCAVDTTLCCVKQNKASIVFPASTRHFYCFDATFLLRQRDISTASTRHFYCVIATFLLRQCDISVLPIFLATGTVAG